MTANEKRRMQIKILAVDDEKEITDLLVRHLSYLGYNIVGVNDPHQALKMIEEDIFHIVISDIVMPGMDGLELLRRIKKHDGGIKVIMITGYVTMHNILTAMRNGADDVIFKPINDLDKLENVVQEAIGKIDMWQNILLELRSLGTKDLPDD